MPSFPDSAVLILLVLLLFGPKKLPVLARQLGKLMNDFRRASNEFRAQMEDELRLSEQADRQKQIAAVEAAAPAVPAIEATLDPTQAIEAESAYANQELTSQESTPETPLESTYESLSDTTPDLAHELPLESAPETAPAALPIATSGELSILPPATGLPIANSAAAPPPDALPAETDAETTTPVHQAATETEALHP